MSTESERVAQAKQARHNARQNLPKDNRVELALYEIVEAIHDLKNVIASKR